MNLREGAKAEALEAAIARRADEKTFILIRSKVIL